VPDHATVAASKASGQGITSFENLYEHYFAENQLDMMEMAMWCAAS
jgi:hypothetical protein